jgi:hypothetical protein
MKTIPLASYNIFEFECDDELTNKILTDIKNQQIFWQSTGLDDDKYNNDEYNYAGYLGSTDSPIPYYHHELFNWFDDCLKTISKNHFDNIMLTICDSWLTKSNLGQYTIMHTHRASIYSGLFYLSTHNTAETIFEYKDITIKNLLGNAGGHIKVNTFVSRPKKNKLIIFPSDILHGVNINKDIRQTRHTLSFNTFYDGIISSMKTGMLDIKVNSVKDKYDAYVNKKNNETM